MPDLRFVSPPKLYHGPEHAPLIAKLVAETEGGEILNVRIKQNGDVWTINFPISDGSYLLLGFHPEGNAEITVKLEGGGNTIAWEDTLHHTLRTFRHAR